MPQTPKPAPTEFCNWGQNFGANPPKFGPVGAFLENFGQIFEKLWPTNAIKIDFWVFQNIFPNAPRDPSRKWGLGGRQYFFAP